MFDQWNDVGIANGEEGVVALLEKAGKAFETKHCIHLSRTSSVVNYIVTEMFWAFAMPKALPP